MGDYSDKEWVKVIRPAVLKRDDFRCINKYPHKGCGRRFENCPEVLHIRHIKPIADGGTRELSNLVTGCRWCHGRETSTYDGGFGNPISAKPSDLAASSTRSKTEPTATMSEDDLDAIMRG